jgi:hypothetical protein
MTVWKTTTVTEVPHITLSRWQIYLVDNATMHFVGYNETEREGRVSSSIIRFDKKQRKGITRSGRVYQCVGQPGNDLDGHYVWSIWKKINKVLVSENVTKKWIKN